jgi:hypothetical protein
LLFRRMAPFAMVRLPPVTLAGAFMSQVPAERVMVPLVEAPSIFALYIVPTARGTGSSAVKGNRNAYDPPLCQGLLDQTPRDPGQVSGGRT